MPKYKLIYFPARARAEIARLLFAAAGVEYENVIVSFEEWPEYKSKLILGQVPVLEIDGVPYHQSLAFQRYLAKTFGFDGESNMENLQCDVIAETCNDFIDPYIKNLAIACVFNKDAAAEEEAKNRMLNEGLPKFLPIYDKLLTDYGGESGHVVGSKLTWADFAIYEVLQTPLNLFPGILEKYPKLAIHRKLVESYPAIKAYLDQRPQTFL